MTPRQHLARRLRVAGFAIAAEDITGALGHWRIRSRWEDVATWSAICRSSYRHLASYDSMTACARRGFELLPDGADPSIVWVHALPARPRARAPG